MAGNYGSRWPEITSLLARFGGNLHDPENFDLTTDEGMGFVGLKEIPITLDLDGFYANDGVYMIAFTAREMEEPKREYMETVTFQIKGDINKE